MRASSQFNRAVDQSGAPFAKLQALLKEATAVANWQNPDEAWTDIARGIHHALKTTGNTDDHRKPASNGCEVQAPAGPRQPALPYTTARSPTGGAPSLPLLLRPLNPGQGIA
jgi:hypothetical protein